MRVLILTITTGHGHHAAAQSISDALTEQGVAVRTIDVYKTINKALSNGVNQFYLLATKYIPNLYRKAYGKLETKDRQFMLQELTNLLIANKFDSYIDKYSPDFIVCTHVFSAQIVDELKKQGKLANVPTIGIVTDYTLHPFWETLSFVEYINLASPLLIHTAVRRGIERSRLCSFGIPAGLKFSDKTSRFDAAAQLGIDPNRKTVLVMGGSMGYGNMTNTISDIQKLGLDLQILAVCGHNKRQFTKLLEANLGPDVHVFGFVKNVDLFMDAVDCVVTKPGGLTVSESIEKQLPLVLTNPIPGQEDRNLDFLLNNGIALAVNKYFSVDDALNYLFNCPGRIESMKERLACAVTPHASRNLASFIIEEAKKSTI